MTVEFCYTKADFRCCRPSTRLLHRLIRRLNAHQRCLQSLFPTLVSVLYFLAIALGLPGYSTGPRAPEIGPFRPQGLLSSCIAEVVRYLIMGLPVDLIVKRTTVSQAVVYRIRQNLLKFQSARAPRLRQLGRPKKLTLGDEKALLEHLMGSGWLSQYEMQTWLFLECNVIISQSAISRAIKRNGWMHKKLKLTARGRSEALRDAWRTEMRQYTADQLVFLDESIFKEQTGWRMHAYAPIGHEARYFADISRGATWSICAATTIDGWLPCTGVKAGY